MDTSNTAEVPTRSSRKKWMLGCSIGCLALIVVAAAVIGAGAWYVKRLYDKYKTELQGYGFSKTVTAQTINITQDVTEPTLFIGQQIFLRADVTTNVAILAQIAEVYGKVNGTVYFRGQILWVKPGAEIAGDLNVLAQAVKTEGTVHGKVIGTYQPYRDQGK